MSAGFVQQVRPNTNTYQAATGGISGAIEHQINVLGSSAKSVIDSVGSAAPFGVVTAGTIVGTKIGAAAASSILKKPVEESEGIIDEAEKIGGQVVDEAKGLFKEISSRAESIIPEGLSSGSAAGAGDVAVFINTEGVATGFAEAGEIAAGIGAVGTGISATPLLIGGGLILGGVALDKLIFK